MRATILALVLALSATSTSTSIAQARPDEAHAEGAAREKSRAAFRRGVAQLRAQDWSGARASFEEAWSLVQHPSILLNLGIARLHTDDPVLAENDLVRFLSEDSGAAPDELSSARDALAEARTKIGTLRIVVQPPGARVLVDGKPIAISAGVAEVRLKGGKHAIAAHDDGFKSDERSVNVPAKSETDVRIVLAAKEAPKAPEPSDTRKIVGWSLAGLGVAALAAGGVMAVRALSLSSDYEDRGSPSFQKSDVKDEGVAFRTGADVALVTALLAGTGAVILLLTNIGEPNPADVLRRPLVRW